MAWLLDTNVLSELRKGGRCSPRVRAWHATTGADDLFLSVLVLAEIRRGIENIRRRDPLSAGALARWYDRLEVEFKDRLLPVTLSICNIWAAFDPRQPIADLDGLIAATAIHHGLTLVTRNKRDMARSGVACFDPFLD